MALVNGTVWALTTDLRQSRIGAWHADLELDSDAALSGAVTLEEEGITFVGTVVRSGSFGGRTRARVVGGSGGLSKALPARNYASGVLKLSTVIGDILREAGETLSSTSDASILSAQLPKWHREAGLASHALVQAVDAAGAVWRVLRDGTIWVGAETWPIVSPAHVLIDEDWCDGVLTIAPDAPELLPGTTFLGHRIEMVRHYSGPGGLRTDAHLTSAGSILNKILAGIRRKVDYSRFYRARVSLQNGDGSLQLVPDSALMKGGGLDKVPLRLGIPGATARLKPGARVMLGFNEGSPADPFAALCDEGTEFVTFDFEGNGAGIARIGDSVQVFFPAQLPVVGTVTSPVLGPNPAPFTGVMTVATPGFGIIETGNPKVRA